VRLHQIVKLAPDVGHAGRFLDRSAFVKLVEAGVGVGLKGALEVLQVTLRMLSLAVRRVGEPHCWSVR